MKPYYKLEARHIPNGIQVAIGKKAIENRNILSGRALKGARSVYREKGVFKNSGLTFEVLSCQNYGP
jgi:hypothetical protein